MRIWLLTISTAIRPTRPTALGSADGSMVSHYSIRVSLTLGKLQDESQYIDRRLPDVFDDDEVILCSRRVSRPTRLDTEPGKPER